jgi:hypothetical protein
MVVVGVVAGFVFAVIMLLLSAHSAGASVLPNLPPVPAPVTQVLGPVTTTLGDVTANVGSAVDNSLPSAPVSLAPTLTSTATGPVNTATSAVNSLGGPNGPEGALPALPITALPVLSSPAPTALVGVVSQGAQTTATLSSRTLSAPTLDVVLSTGSAALSSPRMPARSAGVVAPSAPVGPRPVPGHPSPNPLLAIMGGGSGSGVHGSSLDSLPPTILVLALLVAAGMGLERRRRPKARFDLRFSPPG